MSELPAKKISGRSIGDEAVKKATGKLWKEWFALLDKAGGKKMSHKQLAAHLDEYYDISPWWQQSVTVQYELARGLRENHQKPDGYQISRSKTINAPADILYNAFEKQSVRMEWLKDPDINITTAHKNKSLRGKWRKGKIAVDINFYEKSPGKTQVVVQNNKIRSLAEAEKLKSYWEQSLLKLTELVRK